MKEISMKLSRLGKITMLASLTDDEEEKIIKELVKDNDIKLAITVVAGLVSTIKETFVKSIIGCALQNNIIRKNPVEIHGIVHASLDALTGVIHQVPVDASIKIKVAIGSDGHWVAVALYGDSAFYPLTNHERGSLSLMHIKP